MSRSLVSRLIAKDLYLYRWLIVASAVAGFASLLFWEGARGGVNLGLILFITSLVALGIFIVMNGVLKERQDRSILFVLSLPISTMQYTIAKISGALIAFLIPWLGLLIAMVALTAVSDEAPNGGIPYFVAMMAFFLSNFCVLLTVLIVTGSEKWAVAGILGTNITIPVYLPFVANLSGVREYIGGHTAAWTPTIVTIISIEAAVSTLAVALAFFVSSRKKDFV